MKASSFLRFVLAFSTATGPVLAQDIIFTNKTATFTNLQGHLYKNVTLVRADLDGLVWSGGGLGRICFTNLAPATLVALGIPTNRIAVARVRAERKALADKQSRAAQGALAKAQAEAEQEKAAKLAADAPIKEAEAQQKADLAQLDAMQTRIDGLDRELRYTQAAVRDGTISDINHTAVEQLNDLHEQLDRLADAYRKKHGTVPDSIKTGVRWEYSKRPFNPLNPLDMPTDRK